MEEENSRLKRVVADQAVQIHILKEVNAKRVARIRREEGIKVSKKQRRLRRLGISTAERQRAERPGQVWSWDFVTDQTENGSCFSHPLPCWTNTPGNA